MIYHKSPATGGGHKPETRSRESLSRLRERGNRVAVGEGCTLSGGAWWARSERGAPPSTSLRLVPLPRKRERSPDCPIHPRIYVFSAPPKPHNSLKESRP